MGSATFHICICHSKLPSDFTNSSYVCIHIHRNPMPHNLRKSTHFRNLQLHIINGQTHLYSSAATSSSELGSQVRGCHRLDPPRKLPDRRSLSLYTLLHSSRYHTLNIPHLQAPFALPHSTPRHLQGFLPLSEGLNHCKFVLKYRGYRSVVKDDMSPDDDDDDKDEEWEWKADPEEVERVCKVIDESSALRDNMEAALDGCGIDLTHDLVVDVLERCKHAPKPAFRFFSWAANKNGYAHDSVAYNKMMQIPWKPKQFGTVISVLEEMGEKGLLTLETFKILIKAFAAARDIKKAFGLFELMKKYKFKVGVETINLLLDELGKAKLGKEAHMLFEKLEHRFTPNMQTYTVLLSGYCRLKLLDAARMIWFRMIDEGFKPDIIAHNTMLEGLLKRKARSHPIELFEVMKSKGPSPNVESYTILIEGLCKQGKLEMAMSYFKEMLDSDFKPDAAIYSCLIISFGKQNKMDKVNSLLVEMKEKGNSPDSQLYNALIKLMSNRRILELDEIVQVYKKMIRDGLEPTIHTYNRMMRLYLFAKNYDMASAVWEDMKRKGCCPDENSYTIFIGGLISLGRSVKACEILEEMLEKGMEAPELDYNWFAYDFSLAGKPNILQELAQRTKFCGKFEVSNVFARWAEMMKIEVKRRDPKRSGAKYDG